MNRKEKLEVPIVVPDEEEIKKALNERTLSHYETAVFSDGIEWAIARIIELNKK